MPTTTGAGVDHHPAEAGEGPTATVGEGRRDDTDHTGREAGAERWLPAVVAVVALVPRVLTAGRFQTTDEVHWMRRSYGFSEALVGLDPASASATTDGLATMPGVTTMWLGTAARVVWEVGGAVGLVDEDDFIHGASAIHLSQLAMAVATSVLIGLLVALAWRWAGPIPAVAAGVLLATEPFLVVHGIVLHTDELTGLFGATGVLVLVLALRRAGITDRKRRHVTLAVAAGALLAGAFLTKLSGLVIAPGIAVVVVAVIVAAARRAQREGRPVRGAIAPLVAVVAVAAGAAVVTVLLAWPAIWADPVNQVQLLRRSAALGDAGHLQFYRGELTEYPGPLYYAITVPLRMTPWFLVASVVLAPLALVARWRRRLAVLVAVGTSAVVMLSTTPKQFDRYMIVALPFLALAIGMGLDVVVRAARRRVADRALGVVAASAALLLTAHAVVQAPWGLAYFNPLLGGTPVAERTVRIGWGEGLERAGAIIAARQGSDCDITVAVNYERIQSAFPCGRVVPRGADADYRVLYISERQRATDDTLAEIRGQGELVDVVRIEGLDYAEIYDRRAVDPAPADPPPG